MLMPKRTKFRRPHRVSYEGKAKGAKKVDFGENDIAVSDFEFCFGSSFKFIDGGGNDGIFFLFQKSNQTLSGFCVSRI